MMTDLFTTAMAWVQDQGLPEPDSLNLVHGGRVELNYCRDFRDLPAMGWHPSSTGTHSFVEQYAGEVLVSVYAQGVAA